jgi:carbon monoxide dehydrogenase subunit G
VKLSQPESVTHVQIDSKVTLTGVAASMGGRVLAKRTAEVIAEFAAGLQRRICPEEADPGNG